MTSRFKSATFALLTKHGKEAIIAPIMESRLGAKLVLAKGYDTDALGTFSSEFKRVLSPQACALKKAALACELSGLPIGLGSEGSFTTGLMGLATINSELVTCMNVLEGWHITGVSVGPSSARGSQCHNEPELQQFLASVPPRQSLILESQGRIAKGLSCADQVKATLRMWEGAANPYPLTISDDLRAHCCPARQERIALATENLMARLASACPRCARLGFWPDHKVPGLPCRDCNSPSGALRAHRAQCAQCQYEQSYPVGEAWADPSECLECNP